jgi:hypothetical protein
MDDSGSFSHPEGAKPSQRRVDRELAMAAVCRQQSGAIGIGQLEALGFTAREVSRLVSGGAFTRRHQGVLLDARASIPPRGHVFAALLAAGPTAFLSHRTAAAVHGLRAVNVRQIELTVVANRTPRRDGLRIHRTTAIHPDEVRTIDRLRVSSVPRLLVELAPREPRAELDRLIAEVARRRSLDLDRIEQTLTRHPRRPGIAELRAALAAYQPSPHDKSGLERAFADWLATLPHIPAPERNVRLAGRWEIDFLWRAQALAVELDGRPYHLLPADQERDRVKDVWLQRNAISIVRVTEFRFEHDRAGIEADLRHFLAGDRAA